MSTKNDPSITDLCVRVFRVASELPGTMNDLAERLGESVKDVGAAVFTLRVNRYFVTTSVKEKTYRRIAYKPAPGKKAPIADVSSVKSEPGSLKRRMARA